MAQGKLGSVLWHIRQMLGKSAKSALTDRQLLERFAAQRDEQAFATLVQRHGPLVLTVCRRLLPNDHDAEDAFQATFFVLARKATALHWHESVSSWLFEVASRVASKANGRLIRRQILEKQAQVMATVDPASAATRRELQLVLDEEVRRLPERYRLPVVLCWLEGLTRSEAAEQLGWKEGTVGGRLARGRDLLRRRLARRGLALSAGVLEMILAENAATAAVPAPLTDGTVQAAVQFVAGQLAAGTSAEAATLASETVSALGVARLKRVAAVVLAVGLLGVGTAMVAHQALVHPARVGSEAGKRADDKAIRPTVALDPGQDPQPGGAPGSPVLPGALPGAAVTKSGDKATAGSDRK
ncbi:hypothetical protein AYO44_01110 [Planctomycetaceae bacterium SCGC AG-212-F19]|nr:hypothetical protein AYO44_01110 [Planctomycetaceae bacterium SCGC AG-212-F19]